MNEASKNKWIAVVVALVIAAFFFGGIFFYSFNRNVDEDLSAAGQVENIEDIETEFLDSNSDVQNIPDGQIGLASLNSSQSASVINSFNQPKPMTQTSPEGLIITDIVVGTGDTAAAGQNIAVNYLGTLENGTKFDSSYDRGQPFAFTLGVGQVIKGWDQGVAGMKVGGKRKLVIPSALAYGDRAVGGVIPANATLVFEVELVGIQK